MAKVGLSSLLHLGQDHGGYFLRSLFRMSAKYRERERMDILTKSLKSPLWLTWIMGLPSLLTILKGQCLLSRLTSGSSKYRPINRFASKTVFSGLLEAWFLAASPISRSSSVKATHDGVIRLPWSLAMISTFPPR